MVLYAKMSIDSRCQLYAGRFRQHGPAVSEGHWRHPKIAVLRCQYILRRHACRAARRGLPVREAGILRQHHVGEPPRGGFGPMVLLGTPALTLPERPSATAVAAAPTRSAASQTAVGPVTASPPKRTGAPGVTRPVGAVL